VDSQLITVVGKKVRVNQGWRTGECRRGEHELCRILGRLSDTEFVACSCERHGDLAHHPGIRLIENAMRAIGGRKVRKQPRNCRCQCGGTTRGGMFLPGHDARYRSALVSKARVEDEDVRRLALRELKSLGWIGLLDQ
jgi:hypothetical protein